jgi:histone H3/H4
LKMEKGGDKLKKINRGMIVEKIKESAVVYIPHGKSYKKVYLKVSPAFVDEYLSFVMAGIEKNVGEMAERVYVKSKRKTLMEEDVVHHFGFVDNETISIPDE